MMSLRWWVPVMVFVAAAGLTGCPSVAPFMMASTDLLAFGLNQDEITFEVHKAPSEGSEIVISAFASVPWIEIQTCQQGTVLCTSTGPSSPVSITVRVDRGKMALGNNTGKITVSALGMVPIFIDVTAETLLAPEFTVSTRTPYDLEPVSFTDASQVAPGWAITEWLWDFGGGQISRAQTPAPRIFREFGAHTVALTVTATQIGTGQRVTLTNSKEGYIIVLAKERPVASFEILNSTALAGNAVNFVDTSLAQSAPITAWRWDFGDGTTSTQQHPSHVYTEPGVYTVSLRVTTLHGEDTATRQNAVTITSLPPNAAFRVDNLTPDVNRPVAFFDESTPGTAPITAWRWEFGDGAISTEQHPTHIYTFEGTFTIRLTVTTAHGSDTEVKPAYVRASITPPFADFTAPRTGVSVLDVVRFEDTSLPGSYDIISWLWRFGDGSVSHDPSPVHRYHSAGTYDVTLTVGTAQMQDSITRTGYVTVTPATALDEYVRRNDGAYSIDPAARLSRLQYRIRTLYMTSQLWAPTGRTPDAWDHKINVIVPVNRTNTTALLFVREGILADVLNTATVDQEMLDLALASGSVVVILYQMPDRGSTAAHTLAAETFAEYLATGDSDWPLLMPMTKSIVKTMDAVTSYLAQGNEGDVEVKDFVVAGGDLNGWAAWLAAAVDSRVKAVLPMGWSMINMPAVAAHIEGFYNGYPAAWMPYSSRGVLQALNTPGGITLRQNIDPYSYLTRLKLPALLINSANDEFFPPGTEALFLDDLPQRPRLLYMPNVNHYFRPTATTPPDAVTGYRGALRDALPWFMAIANNQALPAIASSITTGRRQASFTVTSSETAASARVWRATASQNDFRIGASGRTPWQAGPAVDPVQSTTYQADVSTVRGTALAAYMELTFPTNVMVGGVNVPLRFDTPLIAVGLD